MIAPLRRVLVRRPATAGDWAGAAWRTPDPAASRRQHEAFCALLAELGPEVEVAAALDGQVDAVYMHDPMVMTGRGGIPLRMAKPARTREPGHAAEELERLGIPVLGTLDAPAYADGGDRYWIDDSTMAIGLGYRTNRAGAAALARARGARGHRGRGLRHAARPGPGLRAAPAVVPLRRRRRPVRVYEPLAPVRLLQDLRERGTDWIAISHDAYLAMGCNILAVRPGRRRDGRRRRPTCAARSRRAASRCTSTTARSCRSRATAGRPASRNRCCADDVRIGYKASAEQFGPPELLIRRAGRGGRLRDRRRLGPLPAVAPPRRPLPRRRCRGWRRGQRDPHRHARHERSDADAALPAGGDRAGVRDARLPRPRARLPRRRAPARR